MEGIVTDQRALINLIFKVPGSPDFAIEFQVDTAFRGALAMPADAVAALHLPFVMKTRTLPASGIPFQANVHRAHILWNDQVLAVTVLAMGIRPLIGTMLLDDHDLHIEYAPGGRVRIAPRALKED